MRFFYPVWVVLWLVFGIAGIQAQTVVLETPTFSWTLPTERVDGTPLSVDELRGVLLNCDSGIEDKLINAPATTYPAQEGEFAAGEHNCHLKAVDTAGRKSARSNTLTFVVDANPAVPPEAAVEFEMRFRWSN